MSRAFFVGTGDPALFESTELTVGPWTVDAQHGGPPAALLTRAVERLPSSIDGPSQIARLTFEILGPVPVRPVRVVAEVSRPGRAVELVEASLSSDGRTAVRVRAWRMRTTELALPNGTGAAVPVPALPDGTSEIHTDVLRQGYVSSVEWRFVTGHIDRPGPAQVWSRLRVPVVAGEAPSGLQRAVAVADSGNGLSNLLDFDGWWFINTELTVHVYRQPAGEWVYLDARTALDTGGVGLAVTSLADERGPFGTGAQALLVGPREPGA
jgi:hypothetical protein